MEGLGVTKKRAVQRVGMLIVLFVSYLSVFFILFIIASFGDLLFNSLR
jgi:hypothetical protein